MKTEDYKFNAKQWPPPEHMQGKDKYLFGFDEDNQPYIVRWEKNKKYEGWTATTLSDNQSGDSTAIPRHFYGKDVDKLIDFWSETPLLMRYVYQARAEEDRERPSRPQFEGRNPERDRHRDRDRDRRDHNDEGKHGKYCSCCGSKRKGD